MNKTLLKLLALLLCLTLLAGCGADPEPTEPSVPSTSETGTEESTEETVEGLEGENGKKLTVDFKTPGVIAENAPSVSSRQLTIGDVTVEMPFVISTLLDAGWTFYSEETGTKPVSPETEAEVMGFGLYQGEQMWLELSRVLNPGSAAAPISDCQVLKITINTLDLSQEGVEFVLPGGITRNSTAADVLAVFGPVAENEMFDSVTVNSHIIYYYLHAESGLSYYFNFNEDGTLKNVAVTLVTE